METINRAKAKRALVNWILWFGIVTTPLARVECVQRKTLPAAPRQSNLAAAALSRFWVIPGFEIAIPREAAELGVDGVNLNYKRGAPFVVYEAPLVDGFRQETGHDPRQLDEWDEAWLRYRAGAVTRFMRELRWTLDEIGSTLGKRLELSATTHPTPDECLFYGLDLATWIAEGLVDNLTPMGRSHGGKEVDLTWYSGLTHGTSCRFCPHMSAYRTAPPNVAALHRQALEFYEGGADGLCFWDSHGWLDCKSSIGPATRRLGHIEELRTASASEPESCGPTLIPLTSLGGCDLTVRYIPSDYRRLYPDGTPHHAWLGL